MANTKISALTSATTPLAGTETLPVVQSGVTKQVSVANLTAGRSVSMLYLDVSSGVGLLGNLNTTLANGGYLRWQTNGTSIADIGSSKQVYNTGTGNDFAIAARSGYYLGLGANGSEILRLTTSGDAQLVQSGKGITDSTGAVALNFASTGITANSMLTAGLATRAGTYTAGATTPSVSNVSFLPINNTSPTSITNFTGGVAGQIIVLWFGDSNTTITRNNAYLSGGVNFTSTANDTLTLVFYSPYWYEVARSVNA